MLKMIVALSSGTGRPALSRVIGYRDRLPWVTTLSPDLRWFRRVTYGHTVVMGRKTWASLPPAVRPLPGRLNVVVTSDPDYALAAGREIPTSERADGTSVWAYSDLFDAISDAQEARSRDVFIIGGQEIYRQTLPMVDQIYLTTVSQSLLSEEVRHAAESPEGVRYFPYLSSDCWAEIMSFEESMGVSDREAGLLPRGSETLRFSVLERKRR